MNFPQSGKRGGAENSFKLKEKKMKFGDMPYCRVTYEEIEQRSRGLIDKMKAAESHGEAMEAVRGLYALQSDMTPIELCYERHNM